MKFPVLKRGCVVDDIISISRLAHAGYCLRRVALLENEQIWKENADTAKGRFEHERVHTARIEKRDNEVKLFEYDVYSNSLCLAGKCDCIEAIYDPNGCTIPLVDYPVKLYPVEFKHGKIRHEEEYEIQLCAQAMCLEEMFQTKISEGAVFYITSHRRYSVLLDNKLRDRVIDLIQQLRVILSECVIPNAKYSKKCIRCSLQEYCMPKTMVSAENYCKKLRFDAKDVEFE